MLKSKPKQPMLFTVMVIYYLGMTVVFFLTSSPYSALHSGSVGPEVAVYSKEFFISPAYIILGAEFLSALFVIVRIKPILPSVWVGLLLSLATILSGIVNGSLYTHILTYIYNSVSICFACMLATHDSNNTCLTDTDVRLFGWVWGALSLAGFGLTLAFPYRYGYVPFEFSRSSRGEITYWLVLCLHLLMPIACMLAFYARLSERWLLALFSAFVTIVSLSTVSRSVSIVTLSPYLLMALGLTFRARHMALNFILVLIALSVGSVILIAAVTRNGPAFYENRLSMEATLDQRFRTLAIPLGQLRPGSSLWCRCVLAHQEVDDDPGFTGYFGDRCANLVFRVWYSEWHNCHIFNDDCTISVYKNSHHPQRFCGDRRTFRCHRLRLTLFDLHGRRPSEDSRLDQLPVLVFDVLPQRYGPF